MLSHAGCVRRVIARCAIAGLGGALAHAELCARDAARLSPLSLAENDQLGHAVAVSGAIVLAGARLDDGLAGDAGAVHVFRLGPDGIWSAETVLRAADGVAGDRFGSAVAVDGETAVIGAPWRDESGLDSGVAYVFKRAAGGGWTQVAKLIPPGLAAGDNCGTSVDLHGDLALVGSPLADSAGSNAGVVHVFSRDSGGTWSHVAALTASDAGSNDFLGASAALSSDRIVAGAHQDDDLGSDAGAAYVFERDSGGAWHQAAKLLAADGADGDSFGQTVDICDDVVVAGARLHATGGVSIGSAYVFERGEPGSWSQVAKLLPADGAVADEFGLGVAATTSCVVIGSRKDDDVALNGGAAYVFSPGGPGGWSQSLKLLAPDGGSNDNFGIGVAGDATRVCIGANVNDGQALQGGAAYVFELACPPVCPGDLDHDGFIGLGDLSELLTNFGLSGGVAFANGDLDGDGDVDLADLSQLLGGFGAECR